MSRTQLRSIRDEFSTFVGTYPGTDGRGIAAARFFGNAGEDEEATRDFEDLSCPEVEKMEPDKHLPGWLVFSVLSATLLTGLSVLGRAVAYLVYP